MSTPEKKASSAHTFLILPFTSSILSNPSPLLKTIYNTAYTSDQSCTILFSTPSNGHGESGQLYSISKASPRKYWSTFQSFLGKVYAALAAGQWAAGKVLMDVEVLFDEDGLESDRWGRKLQYAKEGDHRLMVLQGLDNPDTNPILAKLHPILDHHRTNLSCPNLTPTSPPETLARDAPAPAPISTEETPTGPFPTSALGGTFDHLHAAHKLLLHLALFLTSKKLIVGVMAQHLLSGKNCSELVQPLEERIRGVEEFLTRIGGTTSTTTATTNPHLDEEGRRIQLDVVEIQDPFGPTAWDSDIQCLVVSKETLSGGRAVNVKRKDKGLGELEVFVIDVIAANQIVDGAGEGAGVGDGLKGVEDEKELKELKMGSTAIRQWIRDHHSDQ